MSYLCCPRCGITIYQRHPEIAVEYCPRCIVHARIPVLMETSTAPSKDPSNPLPRRTRSFGQPRPARARGRNTSAGGRPAR
jgi:hypothetical protein